MFSNNNNKWFESRFLFLSASQQILITIHLTVSIPISIRLCKTIKKTRIKAHGVERNDVDSGEREVHARQSRKIEWPSVWRPFGLLSFVPNHCVMNDCYTIQIARVKMSCDVIQSTFGFISLKRDLPNSSPPPMFGLLMYSVSKDKLV